MTAPLRLVLNAVFGGVVGLACVAASRLLGGDVRASWILGAAAATAAAGLLAVKRKDDVQVSIVLAVLAFGLIAAVIFFVAAIFLGAALRDS